MKQGRSEGHDLDNATDALFVYASKRASPTENGESRAMAAREEPNRIQIEASYMLERLNDPHYRLHSQLLRHSRIRPQDREGIYLRETYATASMYLDMFFTHNHKIAKAHLQILGIACLVLAAKLVQRRIPNISAQVFDKNQIFNIEKDLLRSFGYRVNPVTYVALAELILQCWDLYECEESAFKAVKYNARAKAAIQRARQVFQTLDCLNLVTNSLDYPLQDIVATVFLLEHRKFCLRAFVSEVRGQNSDSTVEDTLDMFDKKYRIIALSFLGYLKSMETPFAGFEPSSKLDLFCMYFSRINPRINTRINPRIPVRDQIFSSRVELGWQTYDNSISTLAQSYLNR